MPLLKRTYTLPQQTLERFEKTVSNGKRSETLARLIDDWLEKDYQETLRREIIAGCQDMAELYREVEQEYHPLEEEVVRAQ